MAFGGAYGGADAGWYAYMRLGEEAQEKIEKLEEKWKSSLDQQIAFHIQVANSDEYDPNWIDPFVLRVPRNILIEDLRKRIIESVKDTWTPLDPEKPLKLIMGSTPLLDGTAIGEYKTVKRAEKTWATPYGGQILIVNDQPAPMILPEGFKYR